MSSQYHCWMYYLWYHRTLRFIHTYTNQGCYRVGWRSFTQRIVTASVLPWVGSKFWFICLEKQIISSVSQYPNSKSIEEGKHGLIERILYIFSISARDTLTFLNFKKSYKRMHVHFLFIFLHLLSTPLNECSQADNHSAVIKTFMVHCE